jgi:hypothetical protein
MVLKVEHRPASAFTVHVEALDALDDTNDGLVTWLAFMNLPPKSSL